MQLKKSLRRWLFPFLLLGSSFLVPARPAELTKTAAVFRVRSGTRTLDTEKLENGTTFSIPPLQVELFESLDPREDRVLIEVHRRFTVYGVPAGKLSVAPAGFYHSPWVSRSLWLGGLLWALALIGSCSRRARFAVIAVILVFVGTRYCSSYVIVDPDKMKAGRRLPNGFAYKTAGRFSYTRKDGVMWPTHEVLRKAYPPDYGPKLEHAVTGAWYSISNHELSRVEELREEDRHRPVKVTDPLSGNNYLLGSMDIVPSELNPFFLAARWVLWILAVRLLWSGTRGPVPIASEPSGTGSHSSRVLVATRAKQRTHDGPQS